MRRQRGVTLISLMVGLIISMVAILGMLALYKTAVQVTSESARYARVTGDRAAAILQADAVLQNIGFGLENARLSSTAISCSNINLNHPTYTFDQCASATPDQPALVLLWHFTTPGPPLESAPARSICEGLAIDQGRLLYLHRLTCNNLTVLPAWNKSNVSVLFDTSGLNGGVFTNIEVKTENCAAFGVAGAGAGTMIATLEAHHPITDEAADYDPDNDHTFRRFTAHTCLTNLDGP